MNQKRNFQRPLFVRQKIERQFDQYLTPSQRADVHARNHADHGEKARDDYMDLRQESAFIFLMSYGKDPTMLALRDKVERGETLTEAELSAVEAITGQPTAPRPRDRRGDIAHRGMPQQRRRAGSLREALEEWAMSDDASDPEPMEWLTVLRNGGQLTPRQAGLGGKWITAYRNRRLVTTACAGGQSEPWAG